MFVSVCDRPLVAELTEAQDRAVMETMSATIHRKMPMPTRQLPITGSAHKAGVIGLPHEAAIGALFGVTAQGRGPARLHRGHHPALDTPEMAGMVAAIISPVE